MKLPLPLRDLSSTALLLVGLQLSHLAMAAEPEWVYGVKPGDTLSSISSEYLTSTKLWPKLQKLNNVADPTRLPPGSKLRLPVALLKREAAAAEVLDAQGKVTRKPLNGAAEPLTKGTRLQTGDTIETGADSTAALRFVDASRLLLTPNTSLTLSEMVLLGKTGIAQTVMELKQGAVDTKVTKQQLPAGRYEIKSRAVNLAVRGTDFRASVDPTDQVGRSEVLEGAVQASAAGAPVQVAAGFGTSAAPGQAARTPVPLLPALDLKGMSALVERVPLRFQWPAAAGATRYRAQVFADKTFERLLLDGVFPSNSAKWVDLPDGRYVLRVRGVDQGGLEGLNADQEFVLKARPEPPFISSPVDGGKAYGPEVKLLWSASLAAQAYHVQFSTKPDFSDRMSDITDLKANEHSVPVQPGKYYWRVASIAAGQDHGPFSDTQGYTQRKIPESPKSEEPTMDEKTLAFRWRAGDEGSKYQLQLAKESSFAKPTLEKTLTENQVRIDRPEPGTYFTRIKTIDADGFAGPFGAAQRVEVPEPPSKPWWLLLLLIPLL